MDDRPEPPAMMTLLDVAREMRVSEPTARDLVRSGLLPSVRLGPRMTRVRRSDFEAYLASLVKPAESDA
jgi:excisionase family DNA binding protein